MKILVAAFLPLLIALCMVFSLFPDTAFSATLDTPISSSTGVSLGMSSGKTAVNKVSSLVSTTTTAGQNILSYTVTTGKNLYLIAIEVEVYPTTISTTASSLGTVNFNVNGAVQNTWKFTNPSTGMPERMILPMAEPQFVPGGLAMTFTASPASTTSMTWTANFIGYEK